MYVFPSLLLQLSNCFLDPPRAVVAGSVHSGTWVRLYLNSRVYSTDKLETEIWTILIGEAVCPTDSLGTYPFFSH